jgi:pimeloyl-ACP methyl ester carboxylesterase
VSARTHDVRAADGRALRVHEAGDPGGPTVLIHHGTPDDGALLDVWVRDARERGLRLLGYDRPGYGGSTPHPGRSVGDAAGDVAAIADALGIDRLATWGISGGGPHSLACAALLGDRVVAAASLAGVAPFEAEGLNFFAGMGHDNWVEFGAALAGPSALEPLLEGHAREMLEISPADLATTMRSLISPVDEAALDSGLAEQWAAAFPQVFLQGIRGWADDDYAFARPWGFALDAIDVPVLVWQGGEDRMVPFAHGVWLAEHVRGAEARLIAEDGHLALEVDRVGDVHSWLLEHF